MNKLKHKGILYQSTGEVEIAKFLDKMGFDFEYEFPIAIVDNGKTKIWYPDFYLKEYQMVIEYFGMYSHDVFYKKNAEHKKEVFKNCGIQFIPIYNVKTDKWQEYLVKSILTFIEYKTNSMNKKIDRLEKNKKLKNIVKKILPKFLSKE